MWVRYLRATPCRNHRTHTRVQRNSTSPQRSLMHWGIPGGRSRVALEFPRGRRDERAKSHTDFDPFKCFICGLGLDRGTNRRLGNVTRKRARGLGRNRPDLYLTGLDLAEGAVQLQARWSLQRVSAFSFPSSRCRALAAESAGVFPSVLALPISFSDARSSVSQMGRCIGQDFLSPAYPEAKAQGGLVPPETELGATLRSDDAAETPPATETNHYFRLTAVPPVE